MQILWICWPRTGSTWAGGALAYLLDYRFVNPPPGADAVTREHWTVAQKDELYPGWPHKTVLGIRDPRDVAVSHYYMLCRGNPAFSVENLSLRDYIEEVLVRGRASAWRWKDRVGTPPCSFDLFYREWLAEGVDVQVRHEDLMADREGELLRIARELGAKPKVDMDKVMAKFAGYMRPIYDVGYTRKNDSKQLVLRGESHWHEYLGPEELDLIYGSCGELMVELGYLARLERG